MAYYIGLMSGTSLDAIDAALIDVDDKTGITCLETYQHPLPDDIKNQILNLSLPGYNEINQMAALDVQLGGLFADAVLALLSLSKKKSSNIIAIGSHGQTIRHMPNESYPFTLQIGDPNIIASKTGITTVADFRRKDMALGGQGAPLVPAFHPFLFRENKIRIILNIGGIANITYLKPPSPIIGFDTGPGNMLLDAWILMHKHQPFDKNGEWAQEGSLHETLLNALISHEYFNKLPPKSTGRELFNLTWLQEFLIDFPDIDEKDVQRTLLEFTAKSIADAISQHCPDTEEVIACGGGANNIFLMERLQHLLSRPVCSSSQYNINPDFIEAYAFAWFAYNTINSKPSNLPSVTGAKMPAVLGGIYCP